MPRTPVQPQYSLSLSRRTHEATLVVTLRGAPPRTINYEPEASRVHIDTLKDARPNAIHYVLDVELPKGVRVRVDKASEEAVYSNSKLTCKLPIASWGQLAREGDISAETRAHNAALSARRQGPADEEKQKAKDQGKEAPAAQQSDEPAPKKKRPRNVAEADALPALEDEKTAKDVAAEPKKKKSKVPVSRDGQLSILDELVSKDAESRSERLKQSDARAAAIREKELQKKDRKRKEAALKQRAVADVKQVMRLAKKERYAEAK